MKTQFMTLWDGLTTSQHSNRILIIGATNRPEDVDSAILRRMPQMFYIGLPNLEQRKKILKVILKYESLADDVSLDSIAEKTANYSGSDLHELCRCAAMNSYIESIKGNGSELDSLEPNEEQQPPKQSNEAVLIRKCDFQVALEKMSVKNSVSRLNNQINHQSRYDL